MKLRSILATDCGSTTTKAILIEYIDGEYRLSFRGEAPTTVEAPFEDVTRGVLNATMEVEELSGRKLIDGEYIITAITRSYCNFITIRMHRNGIDKIID